MQISTKIKKIPSLAFFSLIFIYMEIVLRVLTCVNFFDIGLVYALLFAIAGGLVLDAVYHVSQKKWVTTLLGVAVFLLFFLYATQTVYFRFFNKYLVVYTLVSGGANQVLAGGMARDVVSAILKSLPYIIMLFVAPAAYYILFKSTTVKTSDYIKLKLGFSLAELGVCLLLNVLLIGSISLTPSLALIQNGIFDPSYAVPSFGLLHTEGLDLKYNLFGVDQRLELQDENGVWASTESEYEPNIVDIDFDKLNEAEEDEVLRSLNEYFQSKSPTYKNEYTGMYKGYNLVMVVAEGFSPYAIHPELTPTLWKMREEGFDFENFYTPIWGVSTSDGEYTAATGMIPKSGVWSFLESADNYMPYCLGNAFANAGYNSNYAYHNNSYSYYRRDLSHVNMGFDYIGMGSGIEEYVTNVWPQSDLEMIQGSMKDYINSDEPFCAYYMSVSGHLEYAQGVNAMVDKNWDLVKDLDCSDTLKAYYSCNIELDRAIEALLAELNANGIADKTVIAITPDHYPYGLEADGADKYSMWNEMLGHDVETTFELYESCFLLYCQGTEDAPTVNKPCFAADVIPTLLNLFGFEYDSRLLVGQDILSDSQGLVVMSNRSFITEYGRYDAVKDEFYAENGAFASEEDEEEFFKNMQAKINNTFMVAAKVLENDYFGYVLKAE